MTYKNNIKKNNSAFTFIETVVVVGIISLLLPALFAILFVIIRQQYRIYALTEVKRQGDQILNIMETDIRDYAYTVTNAGSAVCSPQNYSITPTPTPVDTFYDKYGNSFQFTYNLGNVSVSKSSAPNPAPTLSFNTGQLNNAKVAITPMPINFSCTKAGQYSAPIIYAGFTICYINETSGTCNAPQPEQNISLNYETFIKMRNYPTE
ncbi:MAG: type II secretion system GspH family protein [Actinobacteria bacterium]|nr:type II secretion system GspH family protein [Actinomycetota bacterium]